MHVHAAEPSTPESPLLNEMKDFVVSDSRKLVEVGQQAQDNRALADGAKRDLLHDQRVAADLVCVEQFDELRLALVEVVNPDGGVDQNHRSLSGSPDAGE